MKKVTQNDIAKALGFSRRTVARALNDDDNISRVKKELIVEYAEKVGYKKNTLSSILAPKSVKNISVFLINSVNDQYFKETKEGILHAAEQLSDYNVHFKIFSSDINHPEDQVTLLEENLSSNTVAGLIIIPIDTIKISQTIAKYNIEHVITIDKPLKGNASHIGKNYLISGAISADMIVREHPTCEDLLIVNTTSDTIASHLYYQGFKNYLRDKNITEYNEIYIDHLENNLDEILKYDLNAVKYIFAPRFTDILINYLGGKGYNHIKYTATGINTSIADYVKEGVVISAINSNYFLHGFLATKGIFKVIFSDESEINYQSNNEIVTKENIDTLNTLEGSLSLFTII